MNHTERIAAQGDGLVIGLKGSDVDAAIEPDIIPRSEAEALKQHWYEMTEDYNVEGWHVYENDSPRLTEIYVPIKEQSCQTCGGWGWYYVFAETSNVSNLREDCDDCNKGVIEVEDWSKAVGREEYRSISRQERYLRRRYKLHRGNLPARIRDYWQRNDE